MKRLMSLLLVLMLLPAAAMAEFDLEALKGTPDCTVFEDPGTVDLVVQPVNQPYAGELEDGGLDVYVDYLYDVTADVVFLRVLVSIMVFDSVYADQVVFTVDGKTYAFQTACEQFEYDGTFMEDYYIRLTDEGMKFLKAVAQRKKDDPIPVTFIRLDEVVLEGVVVIPGADAARLYDRYIDLGGKTQNLTYWQEDWPCVIQKAE